MRYLLMIHEKRGERDTRGEEQGRALYREMTAFGERLRAEGRLLAVESLLPDRHAVRVQLEQGRAQLRDGPFAETREMVGGFFLVECADRAEAVALAQECPAARFACVEVRECGPCYRA